MPTPARTSLEEIVAEGRRVLARDGLAGLTMRSVSGGVGVRAPSLYKRVPSRSVLVRLVAEDVIADLTARLVRAASTGDPAGDLRALAVTMREFARDDPHGFDLLFSPLPADAAPEAVDFATAAASVLGVTEALTGGELSLPAARTVTAWVFGFLRMELAGAFQLGGDVSDAFEFGIRALVAGIRQVGGAGGAASGTPGIGAPAPAARINQRRR